MKKLCRLLATWVVGAVFFAGCAVAQTLYTTHGNGTRLGTVNPITGAGVDTGGTGSDFYGVAVGPDGTLYGTVNGYGPASLIRINPATGAATTIGDLGVGMFGLEVDAAGQMWGIDLDGILYRIDKATASKTAVGNTGLEMTMDVAFSPSGVLYAVDRYDKLHIVDKTSAVTTLIGTISGTFDVMGIMFDPLGKLYATSYNTNNFYRIDPATAAATLIGATGFVQPHGGDIFAEPVSAASLAIPTVSEWMLVVMASLIALFGFTRLRHRAQRNFTR